MSRASGRFRFICGLRCTRLADDLRREGTLLELRSLALDELDRERVDAMPLVAICRLLSEEDVA